MTLHAQWSAPANMLIAGEYAITRPGGLGIAVATAPRGRLRLFQGDPPASPSDAISLKRSGTFRIRAIMATSAVVQWPREPLPLMDRLVPAILQEYDLPDGKHWCAEIDTHPFFDPETGLKRGFGSSAVATLLLVAALSTLSQNDREFSRDEVIQEALRLHRIAQSGRGSGYDIAASGCGGAIYFTGGPTPRWHEANLLQKWDTLGITLHGWNNCTSVSTGGAVAQFDRHVPPGSVAERTSLSENNRIVENIYAAENWPSLFRAVSAAAAYGTALGEAIGVNAELPFVGCHVDDGWVSKASGAGNERGIVLARSDRRRPLPKGIEPITYDMQGLQWEYQGQA